MSDTLYKTHLKGRRMSGRCVRYRLLSSTEIDDIEKACLKSANKETTVPEYNADVMATATRAMIVAISEPCDKIENAKNWRNMDQPTLQNEWHKLFTHKDITALKSIYTREHVVTAQELDAIMGEVQAELVD